MFHPLSLFVGLRYVRARTHKFFVSFITWASLLGVCVGVAALIVILSVMNGFEDELRDRLLSLSAHARVVSAAAPTADGEHVAVDWKAAESAVRAVPGVKGVASYAEIQALAVRTPDMLPVILRGIDPREESADTDIKQAVTHGRIDDLIPGTDRVIVGEVVAQQLGLTIGDTLTFLIPTVAPNGAPAPTLREFTVAGIFSVGLQDHDGTLVFSNLEDVRSLAAESGGEGLRVWFDKALDAPEIAPRVRAALPKTLEVFDWTQDHASYFRAIRIEKTMMALILLLIVAVAAFNIVAMLVMVVTDKRTDIAILRTLGVMPRQIMGMFITQGLVIGWLGVLFGVVLGVALSLNVDVIVPFLENTFGFQIMDSDVYYVTAIPSDLQWPSVAWISAAALLLTGTATIYPALRASRTAPAEALRYE
ncbi:MAG: lipoprotein-releasing ABC transporter permease subunit [Gammaproteobacteria bacterium]